MITAWPAHRKQRQSFLAGWRGGPLHMLMTRYITELGQRSSFSVSQPWAEPAAPQHFSPPTCFTGTHWINLLPQHKHLQLAATPMTFLPSRKTTESTQGTSRSFPESQKLSSYSASTWSLSLLFCWAASRGFLSPGTDNYTFSWEAANSGKPGKF